LLFTTTKETCGPALCAYAPGTGSEAFWRQSLS